MSRTLLALHEPHVWRRHGRRGVPASRSTYYDHKAARENPSPTPPKKRGPKTTLDDAALTVEIRAVLKESEFTERGTARRGLVSARGNRSSPRRLAFSGSCVKGSSRRRRLVAFSARGRTTAGSRRTSRTKCGAPTRRRRTVTEGYVTVFGAVDHCTSECVGIHVAKEGNRFEALEPLRQGLVERFGSYSTGVACGLKLRHDHGSQYMSHEFQTEVRFLGIESSPAFVRAPEGNGVIERFWKTLKEQFLWVYTFRTVEELRLCAPRVDQDLQPGLARRASRLQESSSSQTRPHCGDGRRVNAVKSVSEKPCAQQRQPTRSLPRSASFSPNARTRGSSCRAEACGESVEDWAPMTPTLMLPIFRVAEVDCPSRLR